MVTQTWRNWTLDIPPTAGAYRVSQGWAFKHPNGQEELLVAFSSELAIAAGNADIVSITAPASGYYVANNNIDIVITFNEPVDVVTTGGTPRISLTATSGTLHAAYHSGTGTNKLTFRKTVGTSDIDLNGLVLQDDISLQSGTIKDKGTNTNASLTFTGSTYDFSGVLVDGVPRTISSVTGPGTNRTTGQNLDVTVTFNQPVVVETTGGVPSIPLFQNDGTTAIGNAVYTSGSGTTALVFRYVVLVGNSEATAVKAGANIALNSGLITDMSETVNATVTFAQATLTGTTLNA